MTVNAKQTNWPELLPSIMAAMRATPSINSTMFSPYKILLGEEMTLPIDTVLQPNTALPKSVLDHLETITEQFAVTRELAEQNIKEAQEKNKKYHDKGKLKPTFHLGDKVLMNNVKKTKGLCPKLQAKKVGPFYVCDVDGEFKTYVIRDCATHKPLKSRIHAMLTAYKSSHLREIQPPSEEDEGERVENEAAEDGQIENEATEIGQNIVPSDLATDVSTEAIQDSQPDQIGNPPAVDNNPQVVDDQEGNAFEDEEKALSQSCSSASITEARNGIAQSLLTKRNPNGSERT